MSTTPISNAASFHAEARFQLACAYCGKVGEPFEAHHVIKRQRLRARRLPEFDTRGAIRLCEGLDTDQCHFKIEKGRHSLPTERLPQVAICYVWECLGVAGYNELEREYTGAEHRFILHDENGCEHCQAHQ